MKALFAFSVIALTACGGGGGGSGGGGFAMAPVAVQAPVKRDCSVVLYGDSIMQGEDVARTRLSSPPAVTLKTIRPAYTVEDRSVGGETATARSATFNNEYRPQRFVVIEHGINDIFTEAPFEPSLKSMISYAKAEGKTVIVTGLSRMEYERFTEYAEWIRKVAVESGAVYADWPSVQVQTYDRVHPDQASSIALVEKLASTLDQLAPECRQ